MARKFLVVLVLGFCGLANAADTVFHYSFDSSSNLPFITDQGPNFNDAFAGPLALLSSDVPTDGVPDGSGDRSFDSSDPFAIRYDESGAVTDNVLLLSNDQLETAGGYTIETWFKWNGGGSVNSIIDYAGTDKLVIEQRFGANDTLAMRSDPNDFEIGTVGIGQWHYVAFVMDTSGNTVDGDGAIAGVGTAYFDGLTPIPLGDITKSNFGDSLARSIGIGQHPFGFDLDFFDGSVYEPRVSLGVVAPEDLLYEGEIGGIDGDFNDDEIYDCTDIDTLTSAIAGGTGDLSLDLTGDGFVDSADIDAWLAEAGAANLVSGNPYLPGDGNLDGVVDVSDFGIWNGNKFTNNSAWCNGDFNADGVVDVSDFGIWNGSKFQASDAAAVPEPGAWCLTFFAFAFLGWLRRSRNA